MEKQMDTWGVIALIAVAVGIALAIDVIGSELTIHRPIGYEVILTAIGALVGGFVASEYLGDFGERGYEYHGLYVYSALIGAVVAGLLVEVATRAVETRGIGHA
jgi:uncharacterized membrane protein YeaQ/YmgE (transglycosylase-associated protein family)